MQDYILRGTAMGGLIRVFAATTKNLVDTARRLHGTSPVATAAIGRMLTAGAMMGAMLKNDTDVLTLSIMGDGPLGGIVVTADSSSRVKGYVYNPTINIPLKSAGKLNVSGAIGAGTLTVTRDLGLKEPVSGQIQLVSGEIAEDITYYFAVSEQTPSAVILGVLVDRDYTVKQAGGLILQVMPGTNEDAITHLENSISALPAMTTLLDEGKSPRNILETIFTEYDVTIHDKIYPSYHCNCSREKTKIALRSVGKEELATILKEDKGANLHCHFCNEDYYFDETDLKNLIV